MIEITNEEFNVLKKFVYNEIGISLKDCKKSMIDSRFQSILLRENISNYTEYFNQKLQNKKSKDYEEFIHKITTHHTFFYREDKHYEYMVNSILPWIKTTVKDYDVRIWSAGCSTGEEPYTLAFYLNGYFEKKIWDKKILATDISLEALDKASKGVYFKKSLERLPNEYLEKYFNKEINEYKVDRKIKNEIIFRKFNLMDDFKFKKKFHVIFCRNVMIYFNQKTREKLVKKFENYLVDGGYLIIGVTESITNLDGHNMKLIKPSIYRKI
ncbi:CheR family methyltransferase [Clostridiaceae bacterium HSG29]|nr:CheR family methyltransferase [Clostridiaceae bacterium HSG29]